MAKEFFAHRETESLFKQLEMLRQRSGMSRGQAFDDWLLAMTCALAGETMEAQYLEMIERHKVGSHGKRGADLMATMIGQLVNVMSETDADILGDLFQGSISYGENGLYLTPESVTQLMAELTVGQNDPETDESCIISDPCCGTGRMLLEAGKRHPRAVLVGQDIDPRCARITGLNLGLRGRYGYVICGNTITLETQFAYKIGSFFHEGLNGRRRGVIREIPIEQAPVSTIRDVARKGAADLFDQPEQPPSETSQDAKPEPTILEVPQWVFRLEQQLAAREAAKEPQAPSPPETANPQASTDDDDDPPAQKTLF